MTTLRNFDTDLDVAGVSSIVVRRKDAVPVVTEDVKVTPVYSEAATHLAKPTEDWGWEELRDYVVKAIEARHGLFPRDSRKEYGIFTSFFARWGSQAPAIAQYAFGFCDGMWHNAPISITRFCKGSDPYFAAVIAKRL